MKQVRHVPDWQEEEIIMHLSKGFRTYEIAEMMKFKDRRCIETRLKVIKAKRKAKTLPHLISLWHEKNKA